MKKYNFFCLFLLLIISCHVEENENKSTLLQEIIFPANNAEFQENQIIDFISQGNISCPVWISSIDGNIGNGKSIRRSLSVGTHLITIDNADNHPQITISVKETGENRHFIPVQGINEILFSPGKYSGVCMSTSSQGQLSKLTFKNIAKYRSLKKRNAAETNNFPQRPAVRCPNNLFVPRNRSFGSYTTSHKYSVGDKRTFRVANLQNGTQSQPNLVEAKLIYETDNAYFWVESDETISESDLNTLHNSLEQLIFPHLETFFGKAKDLDNDNHISLLFTKTLNDNGYAIGFFNPSDLFPYVADVNAENYNPTSNEMDILYLGIPDNTHFAFSVNSICATIAHELQHLIHFSLKTFSKYENGDANPPEEDLFIDEGLAHLAETLCGFGVSGGNIAFVEKFCSSTHNYSLIYEDISGINDNTGKRGAMAMFLYWLFEQKGAAVYNNEALTSDGGVKFLRALVRNNETGWEGLGSAFGENTDILFKNWVEELLKIQCGLRSDYPPVYHPITKELMNFPLFAGEIKISDSVSCLLNGFGRIESDRVSLLPYSFCFISDLIFEQKSNFIVELNDENRNLLCSFYQY